MGLFRKTPKVHHEHKWNVVGVNYVGDVEANKVKGAQTWITWQCVNAPCREFDEKRLPGWVEVYGYKPPFELAMEARRDH